MKIDSIQKHSIHHTMEITPLTPEHFDNYIAVGRKAYDQHYAHMWENQDSSPYIESSFTRDVLLKESTDGATELFIIRYEKKPAGILKIVNQSAIEPYTAEDAMLLERIYILKKYTGKGIGKNVIDFTERRARTLRKKLIWLETMQNSPALHFYLAYGFEIHTETKSPYPTVHEAERPMYRLVKPL